MTVKQTDILQILTQEVTHIDTFGYDASLRVKGELDSLDLSLFFLSIQEKYELEITDEEVANLDSINAIVDFLNKKMKG